MFSLFSVLTCVSSRRPPSLEGVSEIAQACRRDLARRLLAEVSSAARRRLEAWLGCTINAYSGSSRGGPFGSLETILSGIAFVLVLVLAVLLLLPMRRDGDVKSSHSCIGVGTAICVCELSRLGADGRLCFPWSSNIIALSPTWS